jgi:hypothetical protein
MNVNGHHSQADHTQAYQRLARSPNPNPAQGTPSSFAQRQEQMYSALSQQQALAAQADISTITQRMQDLDELVQRHQEVQPTPDALTAEQRKVYEYIWARERAANRDVNPSFTAHGGHAHSHPHAHLHPVRTQASASAATSYPTLNPSSGAKWIKPLTQARLGQFNGGHFGDVNLGAVLYERKEDSEDYVKMEVYVFHLSSVPSLPSLLLLRKIANLPSFKSRWSAPALTKPSFAEAMSHSSEFRAAHKGDIFGPSWLNHWFKITLKVPESEFGSYERVTCAFISPSFLSFSFLFCGVPHTNHTCLVEFDPGCEAMIFDTSGMPLQGITGGYAGNQHIEYIIPPAACKAGEHRIVVESSCNGMFGMAGGGIGPPDVRVFLGIFLVLCVAGFCGGSAVLCSFSTFTPPFMFLCSPPSFFRTAFFSLSLFSSFRFVFWAWASWIHDRYYTDVLHYTYPSPLLFSSLLSSAFPSSRALSFLSFVH